jgi:hypothetical protein
MANYKLSDSVTQDLNAVAAALAWRRVVHMETGFPLTVEQLQMGLLPACWRETVPELARCGFAMPQDTMPTVEFRDPSMPRTPSVILQVKSGVFVKNAYKSSPFDMGVLDTEDTERLMVWVNTAIAERRQARLIMRVVKEFLTTHADTTGHVLARWPSLIMLADRLSDTVTGYTSTHKSETRSNWKDKFHESPQRLARYGWNSLAEFEWVRQWEKAMRLAETVLAGALLLPSAVEDNSPVRGKIRSWEPLPDDRDRNWRRI